MILNRNEKSYNLDESGVARVQVLLVRHRVEKVDFIDDWVEVGVEGERVQHEAQAAVSGRLVQQLVGVGDEEQVRVGVRQARVDVVVENLQAVLQGAGHRWVIE